MSTTSNPPLTPATIDQDAEEVQQNYVEKTDAIRRRMKVVRYSGKRGGKYTLFAELRLLYGAFVAVNFNAGKYTQTLGGSVNLSWAAIVAACDGFTNLETLFNEFFVRSITLEYQPDNMHSANTSASSSASGSPGFRNTTGATIYYVPHSQATYADNGSAFYQAREAKYSKFINLGLPWTLVAKNDEKFAWDGPLGELSTSANSQQWLTFPNVSSLGGKFGLITPYLSGAAAGIGDLFENGTFGPFVAHVDIAVRARI